MSKLPATTDDWHHYLDEGLALAGHAIIEAGVRFHQFKLECKAKRGGSNYSSLCKDWFGMSASRASAWSKIGERAELLFSHAEKLPPDVTSVYQLSTLPPEVFSEKVAEGVIRADMKRSAVKELRLSTNPPKKRAVTIDQSHEDNNDSAPDGEPGTAVSVEKAPAPLFADSVDDEALLALIADLDELLKQEVAIQVMETCEQEYTVTALLEQSLDYLEPSDISEALVHKLSAPDRLAVIDRLIRETPELSHLQNLLPPPSD